MSVKTKKKILPLGVKIISIIYYLSGFGMILMSFLLAFGSLFFGISSFLGAVGKTFMIIGGIMLILLGIFAILLGDALWDMKPWARIAVIALSVLGIILAITSWSIISLIINSLIGGYLLLNKDAKEVFS